MDLSKPIYASRLVTLENNNSASKIRLLTQITYKYQRITTICLILLSIFFLSGCVTLPDPETSQEYNSDIIGSISPSSSIGQTFVSRRPGFNGITIWLGQNIVNSDYATITATLYTSPNDQKPLFVTHIPITNLQRTQTIHIDIPIQSQTPHRSYYLLLESPSVSVNVFGRNEDAYPFGQLYINTQPANADMAFRVSYRYNFNQLQGDFINWLRMSYLILPLSILLLFPGWFLFSLVKNTVSLDKYISIILSIGLSLALIPIILLWTSTLQLPWSRISVKVASWIIVIATLSIQLINKLKKKPYLHTSKNKIFIVNRGYSHIYLGLGLIFLISFIVRLIMIRDFSTPAWVDSVHHAFITRLIIDHGTYPQTYAPYFDIQQTHYHAGFHSLVAAFTWLSDLNLPSAMMLIGQVLNALSVLSVFILSQTLIKNTLTSLIAALITGLITPMPAYYTSWGRYTQLTGLLLLPVCFYLYKTALAQEKPLLEWRQNFIAAVLTGGILLIHYRVAAYLICLIVADLITNIPTHRERIGSYFRKNLTFYLLIGSLSIILTLPWLGPTIKDVIIPKVITSNQVPVNFFSDFSWRFLTASFGLQSLVIAGLGAFWGIITKQYRWVISLLLWMLFMLFLANLDALKLPGAGFVNNISVEISFFIPISILGGYFIARIITYWSSALPVVIKPIFNMFILGLVIIVSYLGAKQTLLVANPLTVLTRQADIESWEWISENIPDDETILINPFYWGFSLYAGSDGGYWITPMTKNPTIPPPSLYGISTSEEINRINIICEYVIANGKDSTSLRQFMEENDIHYIYIGERGGVISPQNLEDDDKFKLIYKKESVWIFQTIP